MRKNIPKCCLLKILPRVLRDKIDVPKFQISNVNTIFKNNKNNEFVSLETATSLPVCHQPKEVGPCFALIRRWYHNLATRRCEEFSYGGCRGNQNNFASQRECEDYCGVRRGTRKFIVFHEFYKVLEDIILTLVLLSPDMPCLCKQCRSRSVGF